MKILNVHQANYSDAGVCIGVHRTTISRMVKNQGAPVNENGTIDLPVFFLWLRERDLQDSTPIDDEGMKIRNLYWSEKYRLAKFDRKRKEGKLMPKEEVYREWAKRLNTLFSGIELWASRLSPWLEGKTRDEIFRIFKDEIYLLRKTFAEKGRYCPDVDGPVELKD